MKGEELETANTDNLFKGFGVLWCTSDEAAEGSLSRERVSFLFQ